MCLGRVRWKASATLIQVPFQVPGKDVIAVQLWDLLFVRLGIVGACVEVLRGATDQFAENAGEVGAARSRNVIEQELVRGPDPG